jgi:hypothetical protein
MKACTRCGASKPIDKFPHRKGSPDSWCYSCYSEKSKEYHRLNPDKVAARRKRPEVKAKKSAHDAAYRAKNKESLRIRKAAYYAENRESIRIKSAASYRANPDSARSRALAWKQNNKPQHNAGCMARHTRKLGATPPWLSEDQKWMIAEAYDLARIRNEVTGIKWHVDHIVPLQGRNVCGLHVPWNLQVIPASVNCSKRNSFP